MRVKLILPALAEATSPLWRPIKYSLFPPLGLATLAREVFDRYGLPMLVTETSVEGPAVAREIWLQNLIDDISQLREEGIPLNGLIWWPMFDQIDWDGAWKHGGD